MSFRAEPRSGVVEESPVVEPSFGMIAIPRLRMRYARAPLGMTNVT